MRTFLAAVSSVKGGSGGLLSMSAPWRGVDRSVYVRCSLGHVDGSVYNERMNTQTDRNDALPSARARILYTAHELFYRDGVRATGIARVIAAAIAAVLPKARQRAQIAQAVALAIDGAIVRAQFDPSPDAALAALP